MIARHEPVTPPDRPEAGSSADWLAVAMRGAPVPVAVSSLADGTLVEVNDAFCRLFQCPRNEAIGRTARALGLWPDEGQRDRLLALLHRHGSVSGYEAGYRNRRGELGRLEISATLVERDGTAYLVGFLTDVSVQHELLQGLQAAHARLGVALHATGLLVFRQDHDLRYTWVANPALGSTESQLIGRTDDEIMGAAAAEPLVAIKRRVLRTGRSERRDVWVAHNDQLGCFDLVVEPEVDATGRVVAIVCAAQDITERKVASEAAQASRQLRHTIQGMASLIARERLTDWQVNRLQRITQGADRLGRASAPGRAAPPRDAQASLRQLRERHAGALVLVVEHNAVLRELITALLEGAGLRVAEARTGVEAFSLSVQFTPALLLLDMELPQRGGVAAARAVRAMVRQRLPIVAMVSIDPPDGIALVLDADVDDVLDKPVPADRLYEKVLAWLGA